MLNDVFEMAYSSHFFCLKDDTVTYRYSYITQARIGLVDSRQLQATDLTQSDKNLKTLLFLLYKLT
jgi:hypothetical protein